MGKFFGVDSLILSEYVEGEACLSVHAEISSGGDVYSGELSSSFALSSFLIDRETYTISLGGPELKALYNSS
jgi:hypothetical protein